ncbi:MAG: ABC transporter permease [Clostridia bacterium]|nr:ABC transporter permease [Clostridia bacterium]
MSAYPAFVRKEFLEALRTWRLPVLAAVFALIGMTSPVMAKIAPELLGSLVPEGVEITLADPAAIDSWAQFHKNVSQMGLIVMVILFSGTMANEFLRGTLVNLLSKGLSRRVVILAKFTTAATLWTGVYALCLGLTVGYTAWFWPGDRVSGEWVAALSLWGFGILLIALILFGGTLFRTSYGCLLFTGGVVAVLLLADLSPALRDFNPIRLTSGCTALLSGKIPASDMIGPAIAAVVLSAGCLTAAVAVFNRKTV